MAKLFFFVGLVIGVLVAPPSVLAAVVINEFSSASTTEWVELFNTDPNTSVDLTGWTLEETTRGVSQTLSGTLPRQGMLTFSFTPDSDSLPDDGGVLVLKDESGNQQFVVYYGNQSGTPHVAAPQATQSANAKESGGAHDYDWSVGTPNKGWCDTSFSQCPSIESIVALMAAEGVTTNLGEQDDLSRITGLYFERTGYGRIDFAAEMNFTDRDALIWLQQMDNNLDMSQKGRISLDADLIANIVDTQATLTMYNLTFNNPTIRVYNSDGTPGDSSIVSNLSYDRSTGTLTFTAAHFTTFEAVESETPTSSAPSPAGPPGCHDWPPTGRPHLFQIKATDKTATLYFTPVNDHLSYYYIAYGFTKGDVRFGVEFPASLSTGVESFTIGGLAPNTVYYFKVRGGNGCMPGEWSNWLAVRTKSSGPSVQKETKKETKKEEPAPLPKPTPTPTLLPTPFLTPTPSPTISPPQPPPTPKPVNPFIRFFKNLLSFLFG